MPDPPKSFVPDKPEVQVPSTFVPDAVAPSTFVPDEPVSTPLPPQFAMDVPETKPSGGFLDQVKAAALSSAAPVAIARLVADKVIRPNIDKIVPQLAGQQPGVLNPNPEQNPAILKSWLPETEATPGPVGAARHALYEGVVRPLASPAGLLTGMVGEPAQESGLEAAFGSAAPKPKFRFDPATKLYTSMENPELVFDSLGNRMDPVGKLLRKMEETPEKIKEQAGMYTEERAKRFQAAKEVPSEGQQRFFDEKKALAGEYDKVSNDPLELQQPDVDSLFNKIHEYPFMDWITKLHGKEGLNKILNGDVPQQNELNILNKIFGNEITDAAAKLTKHNLFTDVINIPKGLMAGVDISMPFRQGAPLTGQRAWLSSWIPMVKAYGSEEAYNTALRKIQGDRWYDFGQDVGLDITNLGSRREDYFLSNLPDKISIAGVKPWRASNRAAVTFNNSVRQGTFSSMMDDAMKVYETAKNLGGTHKVLRFLNDMTPEQIEQLDPTKNRELAKSFADMANYGSGRGSLGRWEKGASVLNDIFFSPRNTMSRVQTMAQVLNPYNYVFTHPTIRKQTWKMAASLAGLLGTTAALGKMAGASISMDPDNADFGKVRLGNTRIDPGAGLLQFAVLAARMWNQSQTSSTGPAGVPGKEQPFGVGYKPPTSTGTAINFAANRLNPVWGFLYNMGNATYKQPMDVTDSVLRMAVPMAHQDLIDLYHDDPKLVPWAAPLFMTGFGGQTYEKGNFNAPLFPDLPTTKVPQR